MELKFKKVTMQTKFTYNVGDRVVKDGHPGQVIGVKAYNAGIRYLVDFDEPGVGFHNGEAIGVTVGRYGTSNNCLWCRKVDLQPIESNPEPTKMYCIKDYRKYLTKGKTYEFDGGIVSYDNGVSSIGEYESFDEWKRRNPDLSGCLVPLVKRTAKVGEWIYVIKDNGGEVKAGTIWKVNVIGTDCIYLADNYVCSLGNYLVLDSYTDEGLKQEEGIQDFMVVNGEKAEMLDDIADRLLELAEAKENGRAPVSQSQSQWISVDDRLPSKVRINGEPVYYLCKHASWGCVFVGCFLSKSHGTVWAQQIFHEDSNRRFSVSHWMEIPEPPKEE